MFTDAAARQGRLRRASDPLEGPLEGCNLPDEAGKALAIGWPVIIRMGGCSHSARRGKRVAGAFSGRGDRAAVCARCGAHDQRSMPGGSGSKIPQSNEEIRALQIP